MGIKRHMQSLLISIMCLRTESAGKRLCTLNIQYFFVINQVQKGKLEVEYCPTKEMWADPMTKPLQGLDFKRSADQLMGRSKD